MRPLTQSQLEADLAALGISEESTKSRKEIFYDFILGFCKENKRPCRIQDILSNFPEEKRTTVSNIIRELTQQQKLHHLGKAVGYIPKGIA